MEVRNLLTITVSNLRLNFKRTFIPAMLILLIIPLIYGTSNLDSVKSADCLGRMVILIGLPMFVPLLEPEQHEGIEALITLRTFPYQLIIAIRMCFSLVCTFILILIFEFYMSVHGCMFPVCLYVIRTLIASMLLGFAGLLVSAVSRNTVIGYLATFCLYCIRQTGPMSCLFRPITSSMSIQQTAFLLGSGLAIIHFGKSTFDQSRYLKKLKQ